MAVEKPVFKSIELGKSHRSYDDVDESDDSLEKMLELLQWARPPKKKKTKATRVKEVEQTQQAIADEERKKAIFETLEELETLAKNKHVEEHHHEFVAKGRKIVGDALKVEPFIGIEHVKKLTEAKLLDKVLGDFSNTVEDIYDATRDFFARKKVKTSLTILGCIALFATAGVFAAPAIPALAAAMGPTIAPIIIAGVADIGGAIGLGVVFGAIGSWIGKTISRKIFKTEKRFELSQKLSDQIQENTGVASKEAQMISSYLYNRYHTVQNERLRSAYKNLRTLAIKRANPDTMRLVARFFCVELQELKKEVRKNPANAKLQADLVTVIHILKHVESDGKISEVTRKRIQYLLHFYEEIDAKKASVSKKAEEVEPAVPGVHSHFSIMSHQLDKDKAPRAKPSDSLEHDRYQKKSHLKPKPPCSGGRQT